MVLFKNKIKSYNSHKTTLEKMCKYLQTLDTLDNIPIDGILCKTHFFICPQCMNYTMKHTDEGKKIPQIERACSSGFLLGCPSLSNLKYKGCFHYFSTWDIICSHLLTQMLN